MFHFSGSALLHQVQKHMRFAHIGFPIRKSPDRRLLRTSPRRIAATLRPSSLNCVKASTIHPYLNRLRDSSNSLETDHLNACYLVLSLQRVLLNPIKTLCLKLGLSYLVFKLQSLWTPYNKAACLGKKKPRSAGPQNALKNALLLPLL